MSMIQPCRSQISDRFPVASFAVEVPRSRYFEVACATDPRLFHIDWQRHRTPANFYTSRHRGLLRSRAPQTAWILPPEQLRRFAGAKRIFYALGTYGGPSGDAAEFSISPFALDQVPSFSLAPDFTGRSLDRTRLGGAPSAATYGAPTGQPLRWGGDDVLEASRSIEEPTNGDYDDGHSPDLWRKDDPAGSEGVEDSASAMPVAEQAAYDIGIALESETDDPGAEEAESQRSETEPGDPEDPEASNGEAPGASDATDLAPTPPGMETDGGAMTPRRDAASEQAPSDADPLDDDDPPDGFEDAAALYAGGYQDGPYGDDTAGPGTARNAYGAVATAPPQESIQAEPEGEADARTAAPAPAPAPGPEPNGNPSTPSAPPAAESPDGVGEGRDPDYQEEVGEEELLPVGSASRALAMVALDIPEKVRLLRVVAVPESGRAGYSAINPDNEYNDPGHPAYRSYHIGLSWGLIQFTQRSGSLGRVLRAAKRREEALTDLPAEHRFAALFGPDWEELLRITNASEADARVAPVGGATLWEPAWTARFRAAGAVPYITYAQNEVAITQYVDPVLPVAGWLGFNTPRSLAMLVDRCIHMGVGGGLRWTMRAVGPVRTQADRDAALRALGRADLRAFQTSFVPRLAVDGRWGPRSHAAMTSALRALGATSPVAVSDRDAMLRAMVDASRSRRFHRRLDALHANRDDFSDDVTYALT
jgi:hypothetical protein